MPAHQYVFGDLLDHIPFPRLKNERANHLVSAPFEAIPLIKFLDFVNSVVQIDDFLVIKDQFLLSLVAYDLL